MAIKYECKYECLHSSGDAEGGERISFTVVSDNPCSPSFTPPTQYQASSCRLVSSKQIEYQGAQDRAGNAAVGGVAGAIVVILLVSNPGGWVVVGGAAVGAAIGWIFG